MAIKAVTSSPTQELKEELIKHKICSSNDLRACRQEIRQLAQDLPIFDSLWLDALVRLGKLTSWQATTINEKGVSELIIGDYILNDFLQQNTVVTTYLAKKQGRSQKFLLRKYQLEGLNRELVLQQLEMVSRKINSENVHRHEKISQILVQKDSVSLISQYENGLNLKQLLIRRGRLPSALVWEIARQLLTAMSELHQQQMVHGSLTLQNIQLLKNGKIQLVNGGINQIFFQTIKELQQLSPDQFDGFAPELTDIGNMPNYATDLYSTGCVLWELLAGRPMFIAGDSLLKIQRHQQGKITDITEIAPDTSLPLAKLIQELTAYHPTDRPKSAQEALQKYFISRNNWSFGLRNLASQVCEQSTRWQSLPIRTRINPGLAMIPVMVLLIGALFYQGDFGKKAQAVFISRWELLTSSTTAPTVKSLSEDAEQKNVVWKDIPTNSARSKSLEVENGIPQPDAEGKILLKSGGTYTATDLESQIPLRIVTNQTEPATILLTEQTWKIKAPLISLQGVVLITSSLPAGGGEVPGETGKLAGMMDVSTSQLLLERVIWQGPTTASKELAVINITGYQENEAVKINLEQMVFLGAAHALQLPESSYQVMVQNSLKTGRGSLFLCQRRGNRNTEFERIQVNNVTLREADHLLEVRNNQLAGITRAIEINAEKNVFDLQTGSDLCVFQSVQPPAYPLNDTQIREMFQWVGQENLISQSTEFTLGFWARNQAGRKIRLTGLVPGEGFLPTKWTYRGESLRKLSDNELESYEGPKFSAQLPGFHVSVTKDNDW